MMVAGVLGTVAGDLASKVITEPGAAALFFVLVAVTIGLFRSRGILLQAAAYWTVVALIRTAGTAAGDMFAHQIGLAASTLVTGVTFLVLVIVSSRTRGAMAAAR
jgi:uncharacterized membrane-anchored protein